MIGGIWCFFCSWTGSCRRLLSLFDWPFFRRYFAWQVSWVLLSWVRSVCTPFIFPSKLAVSSPPQSSFGRTLRRWPWLFPPRAFKFIAVIVPVMRFIILIWGSFQGILFGLAFGSLISTCVALTSALITSPFIVFLWIARGFYVRFFTSL